MRTRQDRSKHRNGAQARFAAAATLPDDALEPTRREASQGDAKASLKETAMDVRGYALTISIVAALCNGMAVPASALPNMTHAFAKREVARCGGDVAQASKHYRYQNSSRSYSGDGAGCYGYGPSSPWYPE